MTRCHARLRGAPSELAGPRCGHAMHGRGLNSHCDQLRSCGDPGPVENVRYIESYMKLLLERSRISHMKLKSEVCFTLYYDASSSIRL